MQTLSLIPECTIAVSTKEEGNIVSYEDLVRLPPLYKKDKVPYLPEHEHATRIVYLTDENIETPPVAADIVVTNSRRVVIAHQYADCVPFVCIDRKKKAFVSSHLGWKGLTMGGVQVSVMALQAFAKSDPTDLWVWIGPCIQKQSYLFEAIPIQSMLSTWTTSIEQIEENGTIRWAIDLPGFIQSECSRIGIDPAQTISDGRDTYTEPEVFFSHRRFVEKADQEKGNFAVMCWIN
ncbi:MAG: polyphenol oxidase family protein [Candidatus Woesebacteria bacterium]